MELGAEAVVSTVALRCDWREGEDARLAPGADDGPAARTALRGRTVPAAAGNAISGGAVCANCNDTPAEAWEITGTSVCVGSAPFAVD